MRSADRRFSATEQELGPPVYFRPTLDSAGVRVLYLTHDIARLLNRYLGGVFTEDKKDITEILYPHVDSLKKFIPVFYGHWGGYWHYKQMPVISGILFTRSMSRCAVDFRDSWCTGGTASAVLRNGKWIYKKPDAFWIE